MAFDRSEKGSQLALRARIACLSNTYTGEVPATEPVRKQHAGGSKDPTPENLADEAEGPHPCAQVYSSNQTATLQWLRLVGVSALGATSEIDPGPTLEVMQAAKRYRGARGAARLKPVATQADKTNSRKGGRAGKSAPLQEAHVWVKPNRRAQGNCSGTGNRRGHRKARERQEKGTKAGHPGGQHPACSVKSRARLWCRT